MRWVIFDSHYFCIYARGRMFGGSRSASSHLVYVTSLARHWLVYQGTSLANSMTFVVSSIKMSACPSVEYLYRLKTLEDRTF